MLNVVMLSVVRLNVVMTSVLAPLKTVLMKENILQVKISILINFKMRETQPTAKKNYKT
jgi:hypothetical protein